MSLDAVAASSGLSSHPTRCGTARVTQSSGATITASIYMDDAAVRHT